jgi:YHS domain-containing protein
MSRTCRYIFAAFAAGLLLAVAAAQTGFARPAQPHDRPVEVAIEGYDPVAYFEAGEPTKGLDRFRAEHRGAAYLFSSQKNLETFRADADRYVPQYGGYCALGMRYGQKSRVDPKAWRIVEGKLYLLLNHGTRAMWEHKVDENISIADRLWTKLAEDE